jgi:hypothetical protein
LAYSPSSPRLSPSSPYSPTSPSYRWVILWDIYSIFLAPMWY